MISFQKFLIFPIYAYALFQKMLNVSAELNLKLHKLAGNFNEMTLRHGRSPVNLLQIFRTPFLKNTFGRLYFYLIFDKILKI